MRRQPTFFVSVAAAVACVIAFHPTAQASAQGSLPPGWATGGSASNPRSQISADTACGDNSVLLFSARGSGDTYGASLAHNKIGGWTQGAGIALIKDGWNVRDLQAIYPAPPVPSFAKIAKAVVAGGGLKAKSAAAVTIVVKQFRDATSNSWQSVKAELEAAYQRCPARKILLGGYSQGAILLRYIVPRLDAKILKQIVSVDLFADPTEQSAVDSGLRHPANLDGRLTGEGIDTFSGKVVNASSFWQTSYPKTIRARTFQYCVDGDLVCDFTARNLLPTNSFNEGKIHASYGFEVTGIVAARRLGKFGATSVLIIDDLTIAGIRVEKVGSQAYETFRNRFGAPSNSHIDSQCASDQPGERSAVWKDLGLSAHFYSMIVNTRCGFLAAAQVSSNRWRTSNGLRIGDSLIRLRSIYPSARLHGIEGSPFTPDHPAWWLAVHRDEGSPLRFEYPGLFAIVKEGRVTALGVACPCGGA